MQTRGRPTTRAARRYALAVGLGGLLGALVGGIAVFAGAPVYSASASVLVQPLGGADQATVNLATEAQIALSTDVALAVAELTGQAMPHLASVEVVPESSVLILRYEAGTPVEARDGAGYFAQAYLDQRARTARDATAAQITTLRSKATELTARAADLDRSVRALPEGSNDPQDLRATLAGVNDQINDLTARANEMAVATIDPGRVIGEPELPGAPVRPRAAIWLGVSAPAGALLGLLFAAVRDRLSRRVRHGDDVLARAGIGVLAELSDLPWYGDSDPEGTDARLARLLAPHHPGGRAFQRLRNEIVAAIKSEDRTLLITGTTPGAASTMVAANLAAALARAENDVVLVGANVPELGVSAPTLARLFDVADVPGLTDVLAGRTPLESAVSRAARIPRLDVVTPGGTASAAGLLQSEGARSLLRTLARGCHYLVVDAPSAASGADAQSLAAAADAAILVVETGRSRLDEVADAALQMERVGTRLLGSVVLPALPTPEPRPQRPRLSRGDERQDAEIERWRNDPRRVMNAPTALVKVVDPPSSRPSAPVSD